jgi:hypothetical protein
MPEYKINPKGKFVENKIEDFLKDIINDNLKINYIDFDMANEGLEFDNEQKLLLENSVNIAVSKIGGSEKEEYKYNPENDLKDEDLTSKVTKRGMSI